jgi:hypothetical protein
LRALNLPFYDSNPLTQEHRIIDYRSFDPDGDARQNRITCATRCPTWPPRQGSHTDFRESGHDG